MQEEELAEHPLGTRAAAATLAAFQTASGASSSSGAGGSSSPPLAAGADLLATASPSAPPWPPGGRPRPDRGDRPHRGIAGRGRPVRDLPGGQGRGGLPARQQHAPLRLQALRAALPAPRRPRQLPHVPRAHHPGRCRYLVSAPAFPGCVPGGHVCHGPTPKSSTCMWSSCGEGGCQQQGVYEQVKLALGFWGLEKA